MIKSIINKPAYKRIKRGLDVIALLYILLLIFPKPLFQNKHVYKSFTIYYHSSNGIDLKELETVLDISTELLQKSELFDKKINQNVFLTNNFSEFTFFSIFGRKAFGLNFPWTKNIFLSKSDVSKNLIFRNDSLYNIRNLSSVIAHETTHSLINHKLGILKAILLPKWKNEGYCEHIANDGSFDEKLGFSFLCNPKEKPESPSYSYFLY